MSSDRVAGTAALRRLEPVRRQAMSEGDLNPGHPISIGSALSNANEVYTVCEFDEVGHKDDLLLEKKIHLLQRQVSANHAETTATLVLAAKIEENPVAMRTLAEAALLPTSIVYPAKLLERELAHQTFATRDQILSSTGYEVLKAYCCRHHIETPQEEADRVTGGKSLLQAIKDLMAAGKETEKVLVEAQEAESKDEGVDVSV